MDEEPCCLAVACGPKAPPLLVATGKIDLGRVLDRQNATASALLGRACSQRLDNPINRDVKTRQKAVPPLLPCASLSQLPEYQRPRRCHSLDQPISPLGNPNIAKRHRMPSPKTGRKALNHIHKRWGITFGHPIALRERWSEAAARWIEPTAT